MITDRFTSIIIEAEEFGPVPTYTHEEVSPSAAGWDTLQRYYLARRASLTPEECALLFPIGARLGTRFWWIDKAVPKQIAPGFWAVEVTFRGWAATKPIAVVVGANAEQQSGENMRFPAFPGDEDGEVFSKVQTHENAPTIRVSYLVEDIDAEGVAMTEFVGTAVEPPVTITVPDSVWVYLNSYVYHWPNGWCLMESAQDRLPGTTAALVSDSYRYIRDLTPG